jgi:hypothetical protein
MDMKAHRKMLWLLPLLVGLNAQLCIAGPTLEKVPLCDLQRTAKQGEQRSVLVEGIYSDGFEMGVLTDDACPSEHTWVELSLQSTTNKEMLRSILDTAGQADVVFEGDFYVHLELSWLFMRSKALRCQQLIQPVRT